MSSIKPNLAPLRVVTKRYTDAIGVERERLSCGHVVRRKEDHIGPTTTERRRCRECLRGPR